MYKTILFVQCIPLISSHIGCCLAYHAKPRTCTKTSNLGNVFRFTQVLYWLLFHGILETRWMIHLSRSAHARTHARTPPNNNNNNNDATHTHHRPTERPTDRTQVSEHSICCSLESRERIFCHIPPSLTEQKRRRDSFELSFTESAFIFSLYRLQQHTSGIAQNRAACIGACWCWRWWGRRRA